MRNSILRVLTCAAALTVAVPCALAQEAKQPSETDVEEAKRRYQRGRELYEDNDLRAALVEIRRAYELAPNYKLLFDIGQICYQLPDYPCALRSFKQYLADGGENVPADRKAEVEKDLAKLEGRVATLKITTNRPGAEILVDDVVVGTTPLAQPVIVGAGKRKVVARIAGSEPVTKTLDVAGTDVIDVPLELTVAAQVDKPPPIGNDPPKPPVGGDSGGKRSVPVVPWVLTGAFAVGAGIAGGLALSASSDYRAKLDAFGTTRTELDEARDSMKNKAIATDVLLGLTAASAVTSIILTATAGPKAPAKTGVLAPIDVVVGPTGVWINGRF
jgi:hypothetical protein